MNTPRDPLQSLLQKWEMHDEPSADFRREVWKRIETTRRFSWREILTTWLAPIPVPALAALALLLVAGSGWVGNTTALVEKSKSTQAMAQAYLDSIDPQVRAIKP